MLLTDTDAYVGRTRTDSTVWRAGSSPGGGGLETRQRLITFCSVYALLQGDPLRETEVESVGWKTWRQGVFSGGADFCDNGVSQVHAPNVLRRSAGGVGFWNSGIFVLSHVSDGDLEM